MAERGAKPGTRERIVRAAHDLFYREGFHAIGVDRICAEVGVTKTTFYNHFESKDDLVEATLDLHDAWWRDRFVALLREHGGDDPREQLLAAFDAVDALACGEEYNGCFFINVAVQFPAAHDPAHRAAAAHKQAMEELIRQLAAYAGATDPGAFAQEFCLALEGAYVSRQVNREHETASIGRRLARLLVERHIPARDAGGATAAPA